MSGSLGLLKQRGAHHTFRFPRAARLAALVLAAAVGAVSTGPAAMAAEETGEGVHVVRPGENLHLLALRYLGDDQLWPELWRLNPEVANPDLLEPGSRLKVSHRDDRAEPAARVERVARSVEAKPEPQAWLVVAPGVFLLERDGVRTREESSAELAFSDGDRLRLGENSLVFLQLERGRLRIGQRSVRMEATATPRRRAVEVVAGRADLELSGEATKRRPAVEVRVGQTRAEVRPGPTGEGLSRTRKEGETARVMVYDGAASVAAGGKSVEVPAGSGTAVEAGSAPSAPEPLLAAPSVLEPPPGAVLNREGGAFAWTPDARAASYELEICRDPRCGAVAVRAASLTAGRWVSPPLEPGRYHWRVAARSSSGLDGFASAMRSFDVPEISDRLAPTGRIEISGRSVERGPRRVWSADTTVRLVVTDEAGGSGMASTELAVDGSPVGPEGVKPPHATGRYSLTGRAVDVAGNVATFGPIDFEVDASAPRITWEKLPAGATAGRVLEPWSGRQSSLEWKSVDPLWLSWKWSQPGRDLDALPLRFAGGSPNSEVYLVADGRVEFGGDVGITLEPGEALVVRFVDEGSDLVSARLRRDPARPEGAQALFLLEARDGMGNEASLSVPLTRR